jgi:Uma2 family endonuclease
MRATDQPRRHKLSVADYERMIEAGVFAPDDRVELIEGDLIDMAPIGPPHAGVTNRLNRLLVQRAGNSAIVAVGNPLKLPPRSMPQPDFQLLRPRGDDYGTAHPESGDVLLAIEVSDTTLRFDRIRKGRVYACAGVHEYWIVEAPARRLHRHLRPVPAQGRYEAVDVLEAPFEIAPVALPELRLASAEIWSDR